MTNKSTKKQRRKLATAKYLSAPALLDGEDPAEYDAFCNRMFTHVKPQDIFEEMLLGDIIGLQWEVMRWRRLMVALVNAEKHVAVCDIFGPIIGFDKAREIYNGCAKQDPAAMVELDEALEKVGADPDELDAKALVRRLDHVERINRLVASAEARRARMIEDLTKHRERFASLLKGAIKEVEGVDYKEIGQSANDDDGAEAA